MAVNKLKSVILRLLFILTAALSPVLAADQKKPADEVVSSTETFIDRQQENISNALSNTVGWFDRFFTPPREEIETNDSFLRVIGNFSWVDHEGLLFKPRFRFRIKVPGLKNRLRLIAEGEDEEEEVNTRRTAKGTTRPPIDQRTSIRARNDTRDRSVGLQFMGVNWSRFRADVDLKFRSEFEPEVVTRLRQRFIWKNKTEGRITERLFWREKEGYGETTQFEIDRVFTDKTQLTWTTAGTYSEKSREVSGMNWSTGLVYGVLVSSKIAVSALALAQGPTRPHSVVGNYHGGVIYRQNILRPWFFFEIEPAVDFNRLSPGFETIPSLTFRMEILFRKES